MVVDVELRHFVGDFCLREGIKFPKSLVSVNEVGIPGLLSSGLTELDALGAFREGKAFLMQLRTEDIELRVAD